jgi:methylated-DNA-protein-cysteine methyltransferase-like protein
MKKKTPTEPATTAHTSPFTQAVIALIKRIPRGKVMTYGRIAAWSGSPRGARQVVRILHACSAAENLPWHRVINGQGKIALGPFQGYELQRALLVKEGIVFGLNDTIDLERFLWNPRVTSRQKIRRPSPGRRTHGKRKS